MSSQDRSDCNGANNPPSFYLSRHYETSQYYTLDEHTSVPDILLISEHVWQNLEPQQQQWLTMAAEASAEHQKILWEQASTEALAAVRAAGVELVIPDKQPFREAVAPMHESYRGTPAGELLDYIGTLP